MAKKVILKDDNVEIMPITRGELVLDSSGQLAFHSAQFLATQSLPGLMSVEDKTKLDSLEKITVEDKKVEQVNTTTNSSYRILFSNSADNETKTEGARKSAKLLFNPYTGALTATALIGKLDWSNLNGVPEDFTPTQHIHNTLEITALTNYSKASSASDLATTDTLNVALGKLEYKADIAYTWYKSITDTDTDDVINKWSEIVDFVNNLENDILDTFVTTNTKQTITGEKTFSGTNALLLTIDRNSSNPAWIRFMKNRTLLGYLGVSNDNKALFNNGSNTYDILHSGNSYIKNGVITINGANITPITSHQSLANYVTLNGTLTISGVKTFSTLLKFTVALGTAPFTVTSTTKVSNLNSDMVDGYHISTAGNFKPWVSIVTIGPDGVSEMGRYIDFHYDNTTGSDYSTRLLCGGNHSNIVKLPSAAGTLALTSQIPSVTNYYWANVKVSSTSSTTTTPTFALTTATVYIATQNGQILLWGPSKEYWLGSNTTSDFYLWGSSSTAHLRLGTNNTERVRVTKDGNVGIGTPTPGYKLHVVGTTFSTGFVKSGSSDSYVLLGGGGHKALSDFAMASAYVKKAGDTMTGRLTMTGGGIIVTTATTSNYRAGVEFYKGTAADTTYSYDAQIGWHNTGGDGTGSICILPYATSTLPWGGSVGLYITKTELKYNNQAILHSGNSSVSGGGSTWGSSITVNINGVSKTLTIPANPNTDYRVTQTVTTASNTSWRPIILGQSYSDASPFAPSTVTDSVLASHLLKIKPSTGDLWLNGSIEASGGTIAGTLTIKRNASAIRYINTDGTVWGWLGFNAKDTPVAYMGNGTTVYNLLHSGNSSVSGGGSSWGSSITVKINGTTKTLTIPSNPDTWRPITNSYSGTATGTSLSLKGANDLYNALLNGYANSAGSVPWSGVTGKPNIFVQFGGKSVDFNFADGNNNNGLYYLHTNWTQSNKNGISYGSLMNFSVDASSWQLISSSDSYLYYRQRWWSGGGGSWSSWKRIAFTSEIPTKTSLLTNDSGFLTSRGYWANVAVSASSSTSTHPTFANMTSSGRIYAGEWIEFSGNTGLYWPNTYGAHFYPNNTSTYGQFKLLGSKGDYSGIHFGNSTSYLTVMSTNVHHGLYAEGKGWEFYYNRTNHLVGILTSTITKAISLAGLTYISSNTWIGTTLGSEMLNVGGWVGTTNNTGWYNITHKGGMYMEDSTYVRTYNGKALYVSNSGDHAIYTAGGFASAKASGSVLATYYNSTWYTNTILTHGNGNLSISPPSGSLYLAYYYGSTYFGGSTYCINRSGYFNGTCAVANSVAWANVTGKPTIPSVGNGTVTIKQAGTSKGSFTMNQSGNTTIELTDNNTWRPIHWAVYLIFHGTASNVSFVKKAGNHNFFTSGSSTFYREAQLRIIATISYPSGWNEDTTMIFGNGSISNTSDYTKPCILTIQKEYGNASRIRFIMSDDSTVENRACYAWVYFLCIG